MNREKQGNLGHEVPRTADVVVIGSGPGGAGVARQLARKGVRVVILEKGAYHHFTGTSLQALKMLELQFLNRADSLVRGISAGGSSMLYFGTARRPAAGYFERHGIELESWLDEARSDMPAYQFTAQTTGPKATAILSAARQLGLEWNYLDKFIHGERIAPGYHPMTARWSSREYLADATAAGAELHCGVEVIRTLSTDGTVEVEYRQNGRSGRISAGRVVVAAGGIGSAALLKRSGVHEAGEGFFCDPLVVVFGSLKQAGQFDEFPMCAGLADEQAGIVLTDMHTPWPVYSAMSLQALRPDRIPAFKDHLAIMVKVKDGISGRISAEGKASRTFDSVELDRIKQGEEMARSIMHQAGARSIFTSRVTSAHPGGSVRIGHAVDENLASSLKGVYVCDCSVFPEDFGLPPTLSILALSRRLAAHLAGDSAENTSASSREKSHA